MEVCYQQQRTNSTPEKDHQFLQQSPHPLEVTLMVKGVILHLQSLLKAKETFLLEGSEKEQCSQMLAKHFCAILVEC